MAQRLERGPPALRVAGSAKNGKVSSGEESKEKDKTKKVFQSKTKQKRKQRRKRQYSLSGPPRSAAHRERLRSASAQPGDPRRLAGGGLLRPRPPGEAELSPSGCAWGLRSLGKAPRPESPGFFLPGSFENPGGFRAGKLVARDPTQGRFRAGEGAAARVSVRLGGRWF